MNSLTIAIVLAFVLISFVSILCRLHFRWVFGSLLILSQCFCIYDIMCKQPAQIMWLCNVTVFINIFLLFKFKQRLFDLFFFYTWVGCFFICLMPKNPYSILLTNPVIWVAYWIKHITPILMSIYYLYVEKKKLSWWGVYVGVVGFLIYSFVTYFYNRTFGQNVLYLNEPAPFMRPLGPYYYWVIIPIGYFWMSLLYLIAFMCGRVNEKPASKAHTKEKLEIASESTSTEPS